MRSAGAASASPGPGERGGSGGVAPGGKRRHPLPPLSRCPLPSCWGRAGIGEAHQNAVSAVLGELDEHYALLRKGSDVRSVSGTPKKSGCYGFCR